MSERLAQYRSWVKTSAPRLKKDAMSFLEDVEKANPKSFLLVATNASYSGYLLNNRTYPGVHMEQGVPTWCSKDRGGINPFDCPVLMHHDAEKPAVGRVIRAAYHRLVGGDAFFQDWKNPARGYDKGSGFTRLQLAITDKEEQMRFLDGRNATFSTSFRSPFAGCSVCHTNLMEENCDHVLGKQYEVDDAGNKRECYVYTGAQFNREVSVVNHPAQPWAVADEINWVEEMKAALADSHVDAEELQSKYEMHSGLTEIHEPLLMAVFDADSGKSTVLTFKEGQEEQVPNRGKGGLDLPPQVAFPDLDADSPNTGEDRDPLDDDDVAMGHIVSGLMKRGLLRTDDEMKDICSTNGERMVAYLSGLTDEADGHTHVVHLDLNLADKRMRGHTSGPYATAKKKIASHGHAVEFDIEDLNSSSWKGETRDATSGPNHTHKVEVVMIRDAEFVPTFEQCMDLAERFDTLAQDADASPSLRNKINSNHHCGPGRTFPVPDCAHADAARRVLPRFKGTTKQRSEILDNLRRRTEELQCDHDAGRTPINEVTHMTQPNPPAGQPGASTDPSGKTPATPPAGVNEDTIRVLTSGLSKEQDRNRELQSLFDAEKTEKAALQTRLTESEKQLHRTRCEHLALLRALNGETVAAHNLDTADGLKSYVDAELVKRVPDSITDSIRDEMGKLGPKLPNLKGLGSFMRDRAQAGDSGALGRKIGDDPEKPEKNKKPTAKELV